MIYWSCHSPPKHTLVHLIIITITNKVSIVLQYIISANNVPDQQDVWHTRITVCYFRQILWSNKQASHHILSQNISDLDLWREDHNHIISILHHYCQKLIHITTGCHHSLHPQYHLCQHQLLLHHLFWEMEELVSFLFKINREKISPRYWANVCEFLTWL